MSHEIEFGTLTKAGGLVDVKMIKKSDIQKCPQCIMLFSHYREDGTCKCDDKVEQAMMIKKWGYKKSDFKKARK